MTALKRIKVIMFIYAICVLLTNLTALFLAICRLIAVEQSDIRESAGICRTRYYGWGGSYGLTHISEKNML